ncbi:two pore calcium channel protein 1B-like isoform X2 [Lycium ferocissimum]|uniref:two pore calcium channel protein 1B-like isoform X2 n=1 Tax=Lycium ferocissimum TaxID=112874 RepID=UPI002815CB7C|nr:two pore calcium channel protein 1B-like isoform X2 [Lycium ferocissimum]
MALKVYTYGFGNYWKDGQNRFDFVITWVIGNSLRIFRLEVLMNPLCFFSKFIFGGIVNTGNPNLSQTDLARYDYLLFNFNDYPTGMVTVFNLLVMGIWPPVMQSYKELTGNSWTYVYFFSFYLIVVLWLLNLIIVFVLEAFRVENEDEDKEERREPQHTVGAT